MENIAMQNSQEMWSNTVQNAEKEQILETLFCLLVHVIIYLHFTNIFFKKNTA